MTDDEKKEVVLYGDLKKVNVVFNRGDEFRLDEGDGKQDIPSIFDEDELRASYVCIIEELYGMHFWEYVAIYRVLKYHDLEYLYVNPFTFKVEATARLLFNSKTYKLTIDLNGECNIVVLDEVEE